MKFNHSIKPRPYAKSNEVLSCTEGRFVGVYPQFGCWVTHPEAEHKSRDLQCQPMPVLRGKSPLELPICIPQLSFIFLEGLGGLRHLQNRLLLWISHFKRGDYLWNVNIYIYICVKYTYLKYTKMFLFDI